jgi:glycosyltransferase involved in cell wall biosynthesis
MKDENPPLVSILCITYNHEKYITQAIEGFLMQKTTFPFEIIIHDDASTDNTAGIIKEYEAKYPYLFSNIYQTENLYSKTNRDILKIVFSAAHGKYIAICEGDDYWIDTDKLQKQVDFLEENPKFSAIGHQTEIIYENYPGKTELFSGYSEQTLSKKKIVQSNVFHTNAIVFRKDALMKYDLTIAKHLVEHALFILIAQSGKFYILPDIMSVYRRHDYGAAGTSTPEKAYPGQILWIREVREILGRRFFWGYHFLSSSVHFYYAINHPEIFRGGLFKRNFYFFKYITLTLLLYPRNIKTVIRLIPKLSGSTKSR